MWSAAAATAAARLGAAGLGSGHPRQLAARGSHHHRGPSLAFITSDAQRLCALRSLRPPAGSLSRRLTATASRSGGIRTSASTADGLPGISEVEAVEVMAKGELAELPQAPGVYAVYSDDGKLQYIGLSRRVSSSIFGHMQDLPDLVCSVKTAEVPSGDKASLMEAWKAWVQQTVSTTGAVPPGNAPGIKDWSQGGTRTIKPEIRLTSGSGAQDVTCSTEDLIQNVIDSNKVVAFIKGTRTDPACGFSFKVLSILNGLSTDYELVNVLDEVHNPGLRDAIKGFSMWPTIPQLYVDGEFVGGADVVVEMSENGELAKLLHK